MQQVFTIPTRKGRELAKLAGGASSFLGVRLDKHEESWLCCWNDGSPSTSIFYRFDPQSLSRPWIQGSDNHTHTNQNWCAGPHANGLQGRFPADWCVIVIPHTNLLWCVGPLHTPFREGSVGVWMCILLYTHVHIPWAGLGGSPLSPKRLYSLEAGRDSSQPWDCKWLKAERNPSWPWDHVQSQVREGFLLASSQYTPSRLTR
jgi:hypothetical protein